MGKVVAVVLPDRHVPAVALLRTSERRHAPAGVPSR